MEEKTLNTIKRHAVSAGITFATVAGLELYAAMAGADFWAGVDWQIVIDGATFAGARAVVKLLLGRSGGGT